MYIIVDITRHFAKRQKSSDEFSCSIIACKPAVVHGVSHRWIRAFFTATVAWDSDICPLLLLLLLFYLGTQFSGNEKLPYAMQKSLQLLLLF